jgi:hypothetical protein
VGNNIVNLYLYIAIMDRGTRVVLRSVVQNVIKLNMLNPYRSLMDRGN